ncbi:MAG: ComEC/Rec2 family competence protein [Patescibacteria group bacterium]
MVIYNAAFWGIAFFLIGVFLASLKLSFFIIVGISVFLAILFLFLYFSNSKTKLSFLWLAGLSMVIILGSFYYFWQDNYQIKNINIVFNQKIEFKGAVIDYPQRGDFQKFTIQLQSPYSGRILVKLKSYPNFNYGDLIYFQGTIERPFSESYASYLAKDGVFGTSDFPKTEFLAENQASKIKSSLLKLKERVVANFQKVLGPQKAAFLGGIVLGERGEFSKEFKEKMNKSGTSHLVALSGYNITIVAYGIGIFLGWFFRRKTAFWFSVIGITAFVLMTGAEASSVRAAIMGIIILLAQKIGKVHSIRNTIAIAGLIMVLINPKVLRFDLGFQLSFAALLGIVYLAPAVQKFFKMKEENGFLNWRENLLITTSAQIAVMPLLLINSGGFSPTSIVANILILETIPLIMFFGFLLGATGFLFLPLAIILGWFINFILSYNLKIIDIFAGFPWLAIEMGIFGAIIYYLTMAAFIFYNNRKTPIKNKI